jgi:hypothetical protein
MKYANLDLIQITEKYVDLKKRLDEIEREYELAWANIFVSTRIQGFTNAETRKAECIKIMENENKALLDLLQELRGQSKKYWLIREAMIVMMKGETV